MEGKALEELGHEFTGADAHLAGTAHARKHLGVLHAGALLDGVREFLLAAVDDLLALVDEVVRVFNGPFVRAHGAEHFQAPRQGHVNLLQLIAFLAKAFHLPADEVRGVDHAVAQFVLLVHEAGLAQVGFLQAAAGAFHLLLFLPQLFQSELGLFHVGIHLVVFLGMVAGIGIHAAVLGIAWFHTR